MAESNVSSPISQSEPLLEEDASLANLMAKVQALETFLSLPTRDLNFKDFMREVLVALVKAVPSEAGSVLELNTEEQNLFFRAAVGQSSEAVSGFTIPVGHGLVGHALESKQPVIVNQLPENQMHLKSIAKAVGFDTRNLVVIPISIRGKNYGAVELLNRIGEEGYSDEDVEILVSLVDSASKAIEMRLMIGWARKAQG